MNDLVIRLSGAVSVKSDDRPVEIVPVEIQARSTEEAADALSEVLENLTGDCHG